MKKVCLILGSIAWYVCSSNIFAYSFVPTEVEFQSLSDECKAGYGASNKALQNGFNARGPNLGEAFNDLNWSVGGWHYCGGVIKIRRGEFSTNPQEREEYFRQGISDANYSYNKIDKKNPWAAEMATTIARAYRGLGETEKAKSYLDEALLNHPRYAPAYVVYALVHFDANDYQKAKEYLLKGHKAAQGQSSEIAYFLGLASLELGEIEEAKKYAKEAKQLGYPLQGLANKIKALEKDAKK